MQNWSRTSETFVSALTAIDFPFEQPPKVYSPEKTILRLRDGKRIHSFLWCYRERKTCKGFTEFNVSSLSKARLLALPKAIERLSKWYRFEHARPRSIESDFRCLSQFLSWADGAEHEGKFENVLNSADQAHEALKSHHTFLRLAVQADQLSLGTGAKRDQRPIIILSEIHNRRYKDEIEPLSGGKSTGTEAPQDGEAAQFMSTLQAVFDSACQHILPCSALAFENGVQPRAVRLSESDITSTVALPENYSDARLMELACVAFAGLAIGDSGANLAQIQSYEEPDDLPEQISKPDKINLTQREIKFRAGGKEVPVHLTVTTLTRFRSFLDIRDRLISKLKCEDVAQMFVHCEYGAIKSPVVPREPIAVRGLSKDFLTVLRRKIRVIGGELPAINLRQLRTYKQQLLTRRHGVKAAAEVMGHSIATAISAYCKTQESVRQNEMGAFLDSLVSTILDPANGIAGATPTVEIPAGACANHGRPRTVEIIPAVQPNCSSAEGCFFCAQFRIHADENDLRKLLSCRYVLQKLAPLQGESASADRVYSAVIDRIDTLLSGIRSRMAQDYERVIQDVHVKGNLSGYWALKLQQLHLLGMLSPSP